MLLLSTCARFDSSDNEAGRDGGPAATPDGGGVTDAHDGSADVRDGTSDNPPLFQDGFEVFDCAGWFPSKVSKAPHSSITPGCVRQNVRMASTSVS